MKWLSIVGHIPKVNGVLFSPISNLKVYLEFGTLMWDLAYCCGILEKNAFVPHSQKGNIKVYGRGFVL